MLMPMISCEATSFVVSFTCVRVSVWERARAFTIRVNCHHRRWSAVAFRSCESVCLFVCASCSTSITSMYLSGRKKNSLFHFKPNKKMAIIYLNARFSLSLSLACLATHSAFLAKNSREWRSTHGEIILKKWREKKRIIYLFEPCKMIKPHVVACEWAERGQRATQWAFCSRPIWGGILSICTHRPTLMTKSVCLMCSAAAGSHSK